MTVVAASIYPTRAAATRLRLNPVLEELTRRGIDSRLWSFLADDDLSQWLRGGASRLGPASTGFRRLPSGLRSANKCDVMILQRETLPINLLLMERLLVTRHRPFIWDVDDALWTSSGLGASIRGTPAKYEWLARHASEVWAGSRHVAEWALTAGAKEVRWVPTTVPVPPQVDDAAREADLLCWIGTPSTGPYIERLLHEVREVLGNWRVLVVGARINAPAGVAVTQHGWSPEAESLALRRAGVGLYPLDTSQPTTSGKSALKSVLFMAHGIPVVATPTASNLAVMSHGREGFFANGPEDWREFLEILHDSGVQREMGRLGHRQAAENFDSLRWAFELSDRVGRLL